MGQKFKSLPTGKVHPNGAKAFPAVDDTKQPFAKVQNCPTKGLPGRVEDPQLTVYATGRVTWITSNYWSAPACTRFNGKHISGDLIGTPLGPVFRCPGYLY